MQSPPVLFVDVCGTLVFDDTTLGLAAWHFARCGAPGRARLMRWLFAPGHPLCWLARAAEKVGGVQLARPLALRLLRGSRPEDLAESAEGYARSLLARGRIREVGEILAREAPGRRVILCSASLEPIVARLAEGLGAEHIASRLEVAGGRLTGRLLEDLTGRKLEALAAKFGAGIFEDADLCVTDNLSDAGLLSRCRRRYVVLHKEKNRCRWDLPGLNFVRPARGGMQP